MVIVLVVVVVVVRTCLQLHGAWPANNLASQTNYTVQIIAIIIIVPNRNLGLSQPLEEKVT
jgi:hypothetical protein